MKDMELTFQDLRALRPLLGGYEYVKGSLDVMCKFFSIQRCISGEYVNGVGLSVIHCQY